MKINPSKLNQIIQEETQKLLQEADVVDIDLFRQQKETETQEQDILAIEETVDQVGDMIAGVAANLLDVIRDLNNSQRINDYKKSNPGKLEALELVWDMMSDWEYEMYPKTSEDIARKKACLTQMPGEDVEEDYDWTSYEYDEAMARNPNFNPLPEDEY